MKLSELFRLFATQRVIEYVSVGREHFSRKINAICQNVEAGRL